jgi:hypothetical protein
MNIHLAAQSGLAALILSKNKWVTLILIIFLTAGCEKNISVDIPVAEKKVVVEGYIEEGDYATVVLTTNSPYFEPVDAKTIFNMLITNAEVTVSNSIETDSLKLEVDMKRFPFMKYKGRSLKGKCGEKYHLVIKWENSVWEAETSIPQSISLDSLKFKTEQNEDSLGYIWYYYRDPDTLGNYYRTFTKTLGRDSAFVHPYASTLDDRLFNGQLISYPIYHGRNLNLLSQDTIKDNPGKQATYLFRVDEIVVIKFCTIDFYHHQFWRSIEGQSSGENPFSSPSSVKSNISNRGLGIWGGYGVFYDTIVCKMPRIKGKR